MIRYRSEKQPSLEGFDAFFQTELDRENRWVKLSRVYSLGRIGKGVLPESIKKSGTTGEGRKACDRSGDNKTQAVP